jgi:hypothetical protein
MEIYVNAVMSTPKLSLANLSNVGGSSGKRTFGTTVKLWMIINRRKAKLIDVPRVEVLRRVWIA